jgi:hypothetical protein
MVCTTEVTRIDEYLIKIDETIWNKKELADFSDTFWEVESAEDLVKSLAETMARNGAGCGFIEGFGYVKTLYSDGSLKNQYLPGTYTPVTEYTPGIEVKILSEDDDISTELKPV